MLVLGIAIPASASQITIGTIETEEQKLARVQAEVLSGNITNDQDVIEVALTQYAEKVAYCRANGIEITPNEALTITQVLSSDVDINGTNTIDFACTTLGIFDSFGMPITVSSTSDYSTVENILANGNIEMYTTTNITSQIPSGSSVSQYKVTSVVNRFLCNGTYRVDGFIPFYEYGDSIGDEYYSYKSGSYTAYPNNVSYYYYPNDGWRSKGYGDTFFKCGMKVYTAYGNYNMYTFFIFGDNSFYPGYIIPLN